MKPRTLALVGILVLVSSVSLFVFLALYEFGFNRGEKKSAEKLRQVGIELVNLQARTDSTKTIYQNEKRRIIERYTEQIRDLVEDTLNLSHEAQIHRLTSHQYRISMERLRDSLSSQVTVVDTVNDVRRATFHIDKREVTVVADVTVPRPPQSAKMLVDVSIKPFTIIPWIECGPVDPSTKLRPVLSRLDVPSHITAIIESARADPSICNPLPPSVSFWEKLKIGTPFALAGTVVGAVGVLFLLY